MARDLDSLPPERFFLEGPVGKLGATLEQPAAAVRGALLCLHPHPLYGGTRSNNVVRHGALGGLAAGCAALRFDFRGAGDSEGRYAEGAGELEDARVAWRWLGDRFLGLPRFVWGFSFGARVGLQLAASVPAELGGYLAVAWPTAAYPWPPLDGWPARAAFLAGDEDEFVDLAKLRARAQSHGGSLTVARGAGHFFPGRLAEVRDFTTEQLEEWVL